VTTTISLYTQLLIIQILIEVGWEVRLDLISSGAKVIWITTIEGRGTALRPCGGFISPCAVLIRKVRRCEKPNDEASSPVGNVDDDSRSIWIPCYVWNGLNHSHNTCTSEGTGHSYSSGVSAFCLAGPNNMPVRLDNWVPTTLIVLPYWL
jgi:hypothetical protein